MSTCAGSQSEIFGSVLHAGQSHHDGLVRHYLLLHLPRAADAEQPWAGGRTEEFPPLLWHRAVCPGSDRRGKCGLCACDSSTCFTRMHTFSQMLPLENEMKTPKSFGGTFGVLNQGMIVIVLLYVGMGLFGYLNYGPEIQGSITLNLPAEDMWVPPNLDKTHNITRNTTQITVCFLHISASLSAIWHTPVWRNRWRQCWRLRSSSHTAWRAMWPSTSHGPITWCSGLAPVRGKYFGNTPSAPDWYSSHVSEAARTQAHTLRRLWFITPHHHPHRIYLRRCAFAFAQNSSAGRRHSQPGAVHLAVRCTVSVRPRTGLSGAHRTVHALEDCDRFPQGAHGGVEHRHCAGRHCRLGNRHVHELIGDHQYVLRGAEGSSLDTGATEPTAQNTHIYTNTRTHSHTKHS